jgi:hypothetical protein
MMAILKSIDTYAIDSTKFGFNHMSNTFFAEASDLKRHELYRQIYDDAADVGFAIRSVRTGKITRFYAAQVQKDREGDIIHWTFKVIPEDARRDPALRDLSVFVIND